MTKRVQTKLNPVLLSAAKANSKPDSLISQIEKHVMERAAADNSRRQDIIHPSELAKDDFCGRQVLYRIRAVKDGTYEDPDPHKFRLLTIFQEGHDAHNKWQTWLKEMGNLWGKWECDICRFTWLGTSREAPGFCNDTVYSSSPHVPRWVYKEVPIDALDELLIHGHEDGQVDKSLIEVKTIGLGTLRMEEPELVKKFTVRTEDGKKVVDYDGLFRGLKNPLKSHRKQAELYLWIKQNIMKEDVEDVIFIYDNKANSEVKEFRAKVEDHLILPLIDQAKKVKYALDHDETLERPKWANRGHKACKACPYLKQCDPPDGGTVPGGEETTRTSRNLSPRKTGGTSTPASRRSNRTGGSRVDGVDGVSDEVGGVSVHTTRSGRSGRTLRRSTVG